MRSRNCSRVSHWRLVTNSSSFIARCAAGPPIATVPSLRNTSATSFNDASAVDAPATAEQKRLVWGNRLGAHPKDSLCQASRLLTFVRAPSY